MAGATPHGLKEKEPPPLLVPPAIAATLGITVAVLFPVAPWVWLALALASLLAHFSIRNNTFVYATFFFAFALYAEARLHTPPPHHVLNILLNQPRTIVLRATINSPPILRERNGKQHWEFLLRLEKMLAAGQWAPIQGTARSLLPFESTYQPSYGDFIQTTAFLSPHHQPLNPGTFNPASYYSRKGIDCQAHLATSPPPQKLDNKGHILMHAALAFRNLMLSTLRNNPHWPAIDSLASREEIAAVTTALLIGYREDLSEELTQQFRETGTFHLFAVSGQNVAVVSAILILLLQAAGLVQWRWAWLSIAPLFLFCLATGMEPSAARAFVMASAIILAWLLQKPTNSLNLLAFSALCLYLWNPAELFDTGFQLSFLVVAALLCFATPLAHALMPPFTPDALLPRKLWNPFQKAIHSLGRFITSAVSVSLAAWIASAPLIALLFYQVTPVTILANLVLVPLATLAVILCGASVAAGFISPVLTGTINLLSSFSIQAMLWSVSFLSALPFSHFAWNPSQLVAPNPSIWIMHNNGTPTTWIIDGNQSFLIDPGRIKDVQYQTLPMSRWLGINQTTGLILTQATTAHMSGTSHWLSHIPSGWIATPALNSQSPAWAEWTQARTIDKQPVRFLRQADQITLSPDMALHLIWPPSKATMGNAEDRALVMRVQWDDHSILWAGDVSEKVERAILAKGGPGRADILLQGPHSSMANLSSEWLEAISPQWIIRPVSPFHLDRSLTPERLDAIKNVNIQLLPMDETGAIHIYKRNNHLTVEPFLATEPD